MIRGIDQEWRLTRSLTGRDRLDDRVLTAMKSVPRHRFVPGENDRRAYDNCPLPIGHGQTISQPFIVALMTDLLQTDEEDTVLEVGTGSGYQAAILSCLVRQVYSIELIDELARPACDRLHELAIENVEIKTGNGYQGWSEHAPYDGIIVTAAAPFIPPALIDQLKAGARLVIPVGQPFYAQELMVVEKRPDGGTTTSNIMSVVFVPLVNENDAD